LAYLLPATFVRTTGETQWRITGWGWQAALYSFIPLFMWLRHPLDEVGMLVLTVAITPSNLGFIAAAVLLPLRRCRAALVCAGVALVSMIASSCFIDARQSELIRLPAGHLGPGYYSWVGAGILMVWTAFSSRSAR
jgi:hypothetical protein